MVFPFGLDAIGWKMWVINASVDILMVIFVIYYFVETGGLTLEEVDSRFDGEKHSSVPDLHDLQKVLEEESGKAIWLTEGVPVPAEESVAVNTVDGKGKVA
jgi:hypothetical protein